MMVLSGEYESRLAAPLPSDDDVNRATGSTSYLNDQHLVLAARSGCRSAFNELWNLHSQRVYRTVFNITKNRQDAEDALQDSFFRAFLSLETFEGRSSFYSWMTRIAINSALGMLRKRRCRPETSHNPTFQQEGDCRPMEVIDLAPDPEQMYDQHQRCARLMQAIERLPSSLQEAVQTRMTEECSVKEVASRLNISESAAKSRLYRARTRLGSSSFGPLLGRGPRPQSPAPLKLFRDRFARAIEPHESKPSGRY
jgi:RNA polymerase sigma-70 factor, ECF subfamily